MECTTDYPSKPQEIGLNNIIELKSKFKLPIGLSDHSGKIYPSLAAVALGAELIEVHATFDKQMFGPDSSSSLTIEEIKELVEGIRYIDKINSKKSNKNKISKKHIFYKKLFGKSLIVNKDLPKNHKIKINDLEAVKPIGYGISTEKFKTLIGKKIKTNMKKNQFLKKNNFYKKWEKFV